MAPYPFAHCIPESVGARIQHLSVSSLTLDRSQGVGVALATHSGSVNLCMAKRPFAHPHTTRHAICRLDDFLMVPLLLAAGSGFRPYTW